MDKEQKIYITMKIHRAQFPGKVQGIFNSIMALIHLPVATTSGLWHVTRQVWRTEKRKTQTWNVRQNSDSSAVYCVCLEYLDQLVGKPEWQPHMHSGDGASFLTATALDRVFDRSAVNTYTVKRTKKKPGSLIRGLVLAIQIVLCLSNSIDVQERWTP